MNGGIPFFSCVGRYQVRRGRGNPVFRGGAAQRAFLLRAKRVQAWMFLWSIKQGMNIHDHRRSFGSSAAAYAEGVLSYGSDGLFFIMGVIFASWAIRIPDVKVALHLSDAELGGLLFGAPLGQLVAIVPTAWLIGRIRSRRTIILGMLLMPAALVSLSLAGGHVSLFVCLLFFGFADNMLNIALNSQAVGVETLYGRSIMATFHGMWSLGGVTGGIVGAILAPLGVSPLHHFCLIALAAVAVLAALRSWTLPREVRVGRKETETRRPVRFDLYLAVLGFIAFGSMATEGAMYDWSSVYFAQVVQPGESLVRVGYVACMSAMVLGRLMADGLINHYGVAPVLQLSGLCIAGGMALALLQPELGSAAAGFALVGFGMASIVPICYSLAGKSTKVPPQVGISLVSSISFFGFLACPPTVGFLSHLADLRWALSPIVVVGLLITLAAPLLRRLRP